MHRSDLIKGISAAAAVLAFTGCKREEARVYEAPKDAPSTTAAARSSQDSATQKPDRPPWTVPPGWEPKPDTGGMRQASYGVTAPDGRSADISVIALGGSAGTALDNLNRWRGQIGLSELNDAELSKATQSAKIGTRDSALYEMVSDQPVLDGKYVARTLAAVLPMGDVTVFFKITGEDALVQENRAKFLAFLQSVATGPEPSPNESSPAPSSQSRPPSESPPSPAATSASTPAAASAGVPTWELPPGWVAGNPSSMRVGSFSVKGEGDGSADISVIALGPQAGSSLANVNRWRGQVGLAAISNAELDKDSSRVPTGGGEALVVDMLGPQSVQGQPKPTRIVAAIVSRPDRTWFYKMTGDDALVTREKENFLRFIKSVKY